jgi:hypothetical protein
VSERHFCQVSKNQELKPILDDFKCYAVIADLSRLSTGGSEGVFEMGHSLVGWCFGMNASESTLSGRLKMEKPKAERSTKT